jgi:hypothetical protein
LNAIKEKAPIDPYIVTCDFNPSLIAAIKVIFPTSAVQIDGFHVMQELNNGIRRDFKRHGGHQYREEIADLLDLRSYLNALQDKRERADALTLASVPPLKEIDPSRSGAKTCRDVASRLLYLLTVQDPHAFFIAFDAELENLLTEHGELLKEFCDALRSKFPKRKFTIKGLRRVHEELLKKLKTLCLRFRTPLKEKAREFSKKQFLLFLQPEKLTPKVEVLIEEFLTQHPTLREYREMTLKVGEMYREPYQLVDGRQIDALTEKEHYSTKLNTALVTLKKYKSEIIAFARVFLEHPELEKSCRANMEWLHKRVKAPFKASLNRQGLDHVINRMQLQLGGEVRNFITEETLNHVIQKI